MFNFDFTITSTQKLIDNSIGNTLHWLISNNAPQVAQMESDLDRKIESLGELAETDQETVNLANQLKYRQEALEEIRDAYVGFQRWFRDTYKADFVPREPVSATTRRPSGMSLIAAKLAERKSTGAAAPEAATF